MHLFSIQKAAYHFGRGRFKSVNKQGEKKRFKFLFFKLPVHKLYLLSQTEYLCPAPASQIHIEILSSHVDSTRR